MAKKPTPKSRRAKSKGRNQYAVYVKKQIKRLTGRMNSPYAAVAPSKNEGKSKGVTKIKV